jgi:hypothetical protein
MQFLVRRRLLGDCRFNMYVEHYNSKQFYRSQDSEKTDDVDFTVAIILILGVEMTVQSIWGAGWRAIGWTIFFAFLGRPYVKFWYSSSVEREHYFAGSFLFSLL